ncbi:MAG TPA: 2-phospho-L-lactate guanylyltransferase [Jatrophihabitantaceae bacterium]|jgi:2-phospho-L-lactate guanylyltransferase
MRWTVVIPVKSPVRAKSRLDPAGIPGTHPRLVQALRADTVAAARAAEGVARVVAVVDEPGVDAGDADLVLVQTTPGLNAALREAWRACALRWPEDGVAALVADLPALRPLELALALAQAADTPLGYVADSPASGTTLLTARPGAELRPCFGLGSAARHARVATALTGGAGLRQDVDTEADLRVALALGVGEHTLAATADLDAEPLATTGCAATGPPVTPRSPGCDRMAR